MLFEKAERLALNCFYIFYQCIRWVAPAFICILQSGVQSLVQGMLENIGQYR